jgi:cytochrome c-type biogenesis protein CcmF
MIGATGAAATLLGLIAALVGVICAAGSARGRWPIDAAVRASVVAAVALVGANLLMIAGLVGRDFSIAYVAQVGGRATPLLYTVASLWGALEGSILFWTGLLAAVTAIFVRSVRRRDEGLLPVALVVLLGLVAFFAAIVVGPGSPWGRIAPVPLDGPGPNPLLASHPLMAIHPPLLYLGFVGLAIPYAITVAALVAGRLDLRWLRLIRRWTLVPWILLTLGLITGAWWSYAVLGWGGYWAWDPVENVALLPWLTATALLHSAMVGRGRGLLASWNVALVVASFALTLIATLITRSGVLTSVHSFTQTPIGPLFLILLGFVLIGTSALLILRPPTSERGSLGPRSRAFLLNNLVLVVIAATVLFGTVFPLIAEAVSNARVSVGAPYFERIVGPLAVGLLVLVGIGPSLTDRAWTAAQRRGLIVGASVAVVVATTVAIVGADGSGIIGAAVGSFVLAQSLVYLGQRSRRTTVRASPSTRARTLGGFVSHAGVGLLALAVVASGAGRREASVTLASGETAQLVGRTVSLVAITTAAGTPPTVTADLSIDGAALAPSLSLYGQTALASPAIVASPLADLYVTLLNVDPASGSATLRISVHPFASWLWPAGTLIALGGLLAAWPTPRRRHSGLAVEPGQGRERQLEGFTDA